MPNILVQYGILVAEMLLLKVIEMLEKPKWDTYRVSLLQFQHTPITAVPTL